MKRLKASLASLEKLMIATLIGGTGLTGSSLVRQLLADPAITKVISISRKSLVISNPKLAEVLISDLVGVPGEFCTSANYQRCWYERSLLWREERSIRRSRS